MITHAERLKAIFEAAIGAMTDSRNAVASHPIALLVGGDILEGFVEAFNKDIKDVRGTLDYYLALETKAQKGCSCEQKAPPERFRAEDGTRKDPYKWVRVVGLFEREASEEEVREEYEKAFGGHSLEKFLAGEGAVGESTMQGASYHIDYTTGLRSFMTHKFVSYSCHLDPRKAQR